MPFDETKTNQLHSPYLSQDYTSSNDIPDYKISSYISTSAISDPSSINERNKLRARRNGMTVFYRCIDDIRIKLDDELLDVYQVSHEKCKEAVERINRFNEVLKEATAYITAHPVKKQGTVKQRILSHICDNYWDDVDLPNFWIKPSEVVYEAMEASEHLPENSSSTPEETKMVWDALELLQEDPHAQLDPILEQTRFFNTYRQETSKVIEDAVGVERWAKLKVAVEHILGPDLLQPVGETFSIRELAEQARAVAEGPVHVINFEHRRAYLWREGDLPWE